VPSNVIREIRGNPAQLPPSSILLWLRPMGA